MKIALFGGSFDPPHFGHTSIINEALKSLDIDKLIIMPTFINPFKRDFFASEAQRLKWAKQAWGHIKRVEICDFETKQARPVPSIESVIYLEKCFNPSKIYLIIGADHLEKLHSWDKFKELSQKVEFIIAKRAGISIPASFKSLETHVDLASSLIRKNLDFSQVCKEIKKEVQEYYSKLYKN